MSDKAVVLLSGGLDSATCLALAREAGFAPYALSFRYGQRHSAELVAASLVADALGVRQHAVMGIDLSLWGGSALTDIGIEVPDAGVQAGIPDTYVPARNLVFLSFATAWAEALGTQNIFIGVNSVDYSGYPDCRPQFISAFATAAGLGTRSADTGEKWNIYTPLQNMSKREIVLKAVELGVPMELTVSCYRATADGLACGRCDSCALRRGGFEAAGVADPTRYV